VSEAVLRFYAELNDFLPREKRQRDVRYGFVVAPSVKDAIEALGVPHTEVDLILADGESVGFDHRLRDGEHVSVYPVFEAFDVAEHTRLRPAPLRNLRFVADVHLGTLARYLRLLGLDTLWDRDASDDELARVAARDGRVLLTRDRGLLKRKLVDRGLFVRDDDPVEQAVDLVTRLDLADRVSPFTRCTVCNGSLVHAHKASIAEQLEPRTLRDVDEFVQCTECGRIYWQGSHHARLRALVDEIRDRARAARLAASSGG
jgi:uncharacterized protein with PIN domain